MQRRADRQQETAAPAARVAGPATRDLMRLAAALNGPQPVQDQPNGAGALQLKKPKKDKQKPDRHGRKDAARRKQEGTLFDERPATSAVHEEPERDEEDESAGDGEEQVSKKDIAEEFSNGLTKLGLHPFLSGGAALHWQGGRRAISDLDFRISAEEAGFSSFNDPAGRAVLDAINKTILVNSRTRHKDEVHDAQAQEFAPIGEDALTIGTADWFGVECSLSVVETTPAGLTSLAGDETTPGVMALDLQELQADKLKTMISRTKRGDASVAKVAQDLFDFLDATRLIDAASGDRPMAEHLDKAARRRLPGYRQANLDSGQGTEHIDDEAIAARMMARAVLTAKAHGEKGKLKGGKRGQAFGKFADRRDISLLSKLSGISVEPDLKTELRPWMAKWNEGPRFGPPRGFKARNRTSKADSSQSPEHLLALWPEGVQENSELAKLSPNARDVVKILALSGGFRALDDSHNDLETQIAFGLSSSQFARAFSDLKKAGFVEGKADGLHFSANGSLMFKLPG